MPSALMRNLKRVIDMSIASNTTTQQYNMWSNLGCDFNQDSLTPWITRLVPVKSSQRYFIMTWPKEHIIYVYVRAGSYTS